MFAIEAFSNRLCPVVFLHSSCTMPHLSAPVSAVCDEVPKPILFAASPPKWISGSGGTAACSSFFAEQVPDLAPLVPLAPACLRRSGEFLEAGHQGEAVLRTRGQEFSWAPNAKDSFDKTSLSMKWFGMASLAMASESEQCYSSRGCDADSPAWARDQDCSAFAAKCLQELNASSGEDLVPLKEVMGLLEAVGQEKLHVGALRGDEWMDRFAAKHCVGGREIMDFPKDAAAVDALRRKFQDNTESALLVHSDELQDGIGARFKKALELTVAALLLGFDAVALNLPAAGGLLHPAGSWNHGPVWCHESPADGPERQVAGAPEYPLRCWRFDLQKDVLAQSNEPEGRQLLWGAMASASSSWRCFSFRGDLEGPPWQFLQTALPRSASVLPRLFGSVRGFAAPGHALPWRREARCGYGASLEPSESSIQQHIAMHIRRGDVGEASGYALTQQLDPSQLSRWLCAVAKLAGSSASALHIFTEAAGRSRGALRRKGLPGFVFDAWNDDDEPIFHTTAKLALHPQVHVVVNNNPREALLCMARADVLITSLSSLSWTAAVLNTGLVLHPSTKASAKAKVHWDLRDQYLDWAENWFPATDVWDRPEALRQLLSKETPSLLTAKAKSAFRQMERLPAAPPPPKGLSWHTKKLCSKQDYYEDCIECCREKMPKEPAKCMRKFCTPLLTKPKPQDLQTKCSLSTMSRKTSCCSRTTASSFYLGTTTPMTRHFSRSHRCWKNWRPQGPRFMTCWRSTNWRFPVGPDSKPTINCSEIRIQVVGLAAGECHDFGVPNAMTGRDLLKLIVAKLPSKPGAAVTIHHGSEPLHLNESLLQQGIGEGVTLSFCYQPNNIYAAWRFLRGKSNDESSLQGLVQLDGARFIKKLQHLPNCLATLNFSHQFDQSLDGLRWPSGLKSLILGDQFNESLDQVNWPSGLQVLEFGHSFNQSLDQVTWPKSLETLIFGADFDQSLDRVNLPDSLRNLEFGNDFDQCLNQVKLPSRLQKLTFGYRFNQSLDCVQLPSSLESLAFGRNFNQCLNEVNLPDGLESLIFGYHFNQSLDFVTLPSGLITLAFGDGFNQSLDGATLPTGLQSLAFGDRFNHSLDQIPSLKSLRRLSLGYDFDQNPDGLTLPSLRSLTLCRSDSFGSKKLEQMIFPSGLQSLVLGPFGDLCSQHLQMVSFPSTLQSLTFGEEFNQVLQMQFPSGLKHLTFGYKFNQSLIHVNLPDGLESLKFGEEFNQSLEHVTLPSALHSLTFGEAFNRSLNHTVLPNGLQSLSFGDHFNRSLDRVNFPRTLRSLSFGFYFNQKLDQVQFPEHLETLVLGHHFIQNLDVNLPSLVSLTLGNWFNRNLDKAKMPNLQELCCQGLLVSYLMAGDLSEYDPALDDGGMFFCELR
eukprot:s370_g11.t1